MEIEYEVIGYSGDDEEWCAGSNDRDEAIHYAIVYSEDYEKVKVYKVTKEIDCVYERKNDDA